jgi:hypothetical protein
MNANNNRYIKEMTIYGDGYEYTQITSADLKNVFGQSYETDDPEEFFSKSIEFIKQNKTINLGNKPGRSEPKYGYHYGIEYFNKNTGETFKNDCSLFVMGTEVWGDNGRECESQASTVAFDDFIKPFPHLGWRVVCND